VLPFFVKIFWDHDFLVEIQKKIIQIILYVIVYVSN